MDLPKGLARVVGSLRTLGEVIGAGFEVVDVVIQDEFAHDVVVKHRPSADEMLDARIASGWSPTPTSTVEGDKILGHAACRVGLLPGRAPQNARSTVSANNWMVRDDAISLTVRSA